VKKSTKFGKIFGAYAKRKSIELNVLRFVYDGQRVSADSTPESLDMDDNDQLDAMLEQVGGC